MEFGNRWKKEIYTMARKSYLAVKLKPSELWYGSYWKFRISRCEKKGAWLYDGTNKRISKN
jgi:hypothetical protein